MSQHSILQRAIGAIGRAVAPVIFDPKRRGQFSFRNPIDPKVADLIDRANIVTNQVQQRFAVEASQVLEGIAQLHDDATDILGTIRLSDETQAINQIQEIFDLPVQTFVQAWVQTLKVLSDSNEAAIRAARKSRTRRGKGN